MEQHKKQRFKNQIRRISFVVAKLYILACVMMFIFNRDLIYSPTNTQLLGLSKQNTERTSPYIQQYQTVIGKRLVRGFITNPKQRKALIYYGDANESIELKAPFFAQQFPEYTTYILPYRGFSGSLGQPTQQGILDDSLNAFDGVARRHRHIVLIGRGLGASVATFVASERHVDKLLLVAPFYSLTDVMQHNFPFLPMALLTRDSYKTWQFAANVSAPVYVLLAEYDSVVPAESSYRLFQAFNAPLEFKIIKQAGHNNMDHYEDYGSSLLHFIEKEI